MAARAEEIARDVAVQKFSSLEWRLNHLYWIQNEFGERIIFQMNHTQRDFNARMWWLNLILKSRQHGITTFSCIRGLDMALFRPNSRIGVIAHTRDDATKFFRDKIVYAYDNLPPEIRMAVPLTRRDMNGTLTFANGSSIEVSVSHRGGTFQYLHISEYGPMCTMYPLRAIEVKSGALNTVHKGAIVTIESTAYGREGDFYNRTQTAKELDERIRAGTAKLTRMDYRFFFYAWFHDPKNSLDEGWEEVHISDKDAEYFSKLETDNHMVLRPQQKAWYVKKAVDQGEEMYREHPSTAEEAFATSREATYFGRELALAREQGRICRFPIVQHIPVNTFWDLGKNDATAIWFHQHVGKEHRFIHYHEDWGPPLQAYGGYLKDFKDKHGIIYGTHYLPHDGRVTDLTQVDDMTREEVLNSVGVMPTVIVQRIDNLMNGIDAMKSVFNQCWFEESGTELGIKRLSQYQKKWSQQAQSHQNEPLKNDARHGADAIRQFAQGYQESNNGQSRQLNPRRRAARLA